MNLLWIFYEFCINFVSILYQLGTKSAQNSHEIGTKFAQNSHKIRTKFAQISHKFGSLYTYIFTHVLYDLTNYFTLPDHTFSQKHFQGFWRLFPFPMSRMARNDSIHFYTTPRHEEEGRLMYQNSAMLRPRHPKLPSLPTLSSFRLTTIPPHPPSPQRLTLLH